MVGMIRTSLVTVGSTPTPLAPGLDADSNQGQRCVRLANTSATTTVYVGGPGVNTAHGWAVPAGATLDLGWLDAQAVPYAVVAMGTAAVRVLEIGV